MKTLDSKTKRIFFLAISVSMILISLSFFFLSIQNSIAGSMSLPVNERIEMPDGYVIIGVIPTPSARDAVAIGFNKDAKAGERVRRYY